MNSDRKHDRSSSPQESEATLIDRVCDEFEEAWRRGECPSIEPFLGSLDEPVRTHLFEELMLSDLEFRTQDATTIDTAIYLTAFPHRKDQIRKVIGEFQERASVRGRQRSDGSVGNSPGSNPHVDSAGELEQCGNYQLLHEVARGGMGVVFKAYDQKLQRTVALKMILDRNLASPEAVQRFYSEAETTAGLDHAGIVPVYDVGSHEGHHYYAMGFVEGPTLHQELRRRKFSMEEAARLVLSLAEAVGYAHDNGVIHRDLKPGNVLLSHDGQPRITDFGLAKRLDQPSQLTIDGQILGTPGYMAPEQAAGDVEHSGRAVDIYALGAIFYHLITGHPPFRTALDALVCILEQEPVPPRGLNRNVPRDLDVICMKCLNKNPSDRYASVRQLADDLQSYLDGELIQARPASLPRRIQRWARHRPRLASVLVTMAAFFIYHLYSYYTGNPGSQGSYHWWATGTILFVCLYAWIYQDLLTRPRAKRSVLYLWTATDIIVFTFFMIVADDGPHSPLVAIYLCMVAGAALSFDRYLVWLVTAGCLLSYGLVVYLSQWFHPELGTIPLRQVAPVTISMLVIGVVQYYVLHCARVQMNPTHQNTHQKTL